MYQSGGGIEHRLKLPEIVAGMKSETVVVVT